MQESMINEQEKIDMQHLYKLARAGKPAQEIMKELDLSDMATLKNALINLMQEKGEDLQIPGLIGDAALNPRYTDDDIRINKDMLPGAQFNTGDEFSLTVTGDTITLKKKS
jgi:hypothetical protein